MRSLFPPNLVERMTRRKPLYFDDGDGDLPQDISPSEGGATPSSPTKATLRRTLSLADLILYGVGCSVGAGIYCLVGLGAEIAGPAIALSFALCGMACVFTALAYGEFAARIPVTGSACELQLARRCISCSVYECIFHFRITSIITSIFYSGIHPFKTSTRT